MLPSSGGQQGKTRTRPRVKGKGANVDVPTLPTAAASLKVQLLVDSDTGMQRWESSFVGPFAKDDAAGLVAK